VNISLVLAEYGWCQSVSQWMVAGWSIFLSLSVGVGFYNEIAEFSSKLFSLCYLIWNEELQHSFPHMYMCAYCI